jgi:predicted small lipoprotein YifL
MKNLFALMVIVSAMFICGCSKPASTPPANNNATPTTTPDTKPADEKPAEPAKNP